MPAYVKKCFRCKDRLATYALQPSVKKQIRTRPMLCSMCVFGEGHWSGLKTFTDRKEYLEITVADFHDKAVFYRNPKATSYEMKNILSWETEKFNEYIHAFSHECGFNNLLRHLLVSRRRVNLFVVACLRFLHKIHQMDERFLTYFKHIEFFVDNPEENCDAVKKSFTNILIFSYDPFYNSIRRMIFSLFSNDNDSFSFLPMMVIEKDKKWLKYLFQVFIDEEMVVNKKYLTADVIGIAKAAYDNRDWSIMPILADALQDVSCEDEKILKQCREGTHFLGCKILDSILGKS